MEQYAHHRVFRGRDVMEAARFARSPGEIEALLGEVRAPGSNPNRKIAPTKRRRRSKPNRRVAPPQEPRPGKSKREGARPRERRSYALFHGAWLGIAIVTLLVGIRLGSRPSGESPDSVGERPLAGAPTSHSTRTAKRGAHPGRRTGALATSREPGWVGSKEVLSAADMRRAAEALLVRETDRLKRELLFPQLLARLTPDNATGVWEVLRESDWGAEGTHRIAIFAHLWGKLDGPAALAAGSESQRWGSLFGMSALESWSAQEPAQARAWVDEQEGEMSESLRVALLKGLAKSDLDAAADYLLALPDHSDPGRYVAPVIAAQLERGLEQAESWVASLPTEQLRSSALEHLARELAKEDPERASQWAAAYAADEAGGKVLAAVAESLLGESFASGGDPERAIGWLESLPAGEPKNVAYASAIRVWARRNVHQAGAFLGQLPDSPGKDRAVRAFALDVSHSDPEAAVLWANIIGDPEARQRTLYTTARHWYRKDRGRSLEWFAEAQLPDELVQRITRR